VEMPGFDPGTFRMLSGRDTKFATPPLHNTREINKINFNH
jgi:hypothetical protein